MTSIPEALKIALAHHERGDLATAERIYRQIVEAEPSHADAWHYLGVAAHQAGRHREAVEAITRALALAGPMAVYLNHLGAAHGALDEWTQAEAAFRRAIELNPREAQGHYNLAALLNLRGRPDEALTGYRRAIELNPRFAEAHYNLGNLLFDRQRLPEAEQSYARALEVRPGYLKAASSLATVRLQLGREREAEASLRRVLEIDPRTVDACFRLGSLLQSQDRLDEALAYLQAAVLIDPRHVDAQNNLGCVHRALDQYEQAERCLRLALDANADSVEALNNLGTVLHHKRDYAAATACFERAIALRPDFAESYNNLGTTLQDQRQVEAALAAYRRALELNPQSAEVLVNIGSTLQMAGDMEAAVEYHRRALAIDPRSQRAHFSLGAAAHFHHRRDEALAHYEDAIRLKPDYAEAYYNRSFVFLSEGDFARGWSDYEWRFRCKEYQGRVFQPPRWDGAPLAGRTLLVHAEQGLGDTLNFIRYVRQIDRDGGRVMVEVQPALAPLVRASGYENVIAGGSPLPPFDVHVSLLSLPGLFDTTLQTVPAAVPYLAADGERVAVWRERLAGYSGLRVGVAWQGNPAFSFDRYRSIPLAEFAPLAEVPGVTLISLQKSPGAEQIAELAGRFTVVDLADRLDVEGGAFMDTAAVMKNVDLVVTSDTAAAHLAGALGVDVWVALGTSSEWRWLEGREDSPWYPTMRLFRQQSLGDWAGVFARMKSELAKRVRRVTGP